MKIIGIYLLIGGIGSILLNQFGYEIVLQQWIDNWGETVGWAIRVSAIVLGAILVLLGIRQEAQGDLNEKETYYVILD